jgi:hypothetical protein
MEESKLKGVFFEPSKVVFITAKNISNIFG